MAIGTLQGAQDPYRWTLSRHQALKIYWSLSDGRPQQQTQRDCVSGLEL